MRSIVILLFLCLPALVFSQTATIEMPNKVLATISGRVILLPSQMPAGGSVISIYLMQEQSDSIILKLIKSIHPDERGNYEVKLESGKYLVRAHQSGFLKADAWDFYVARKQKKVLDFSLIVTGGDFGPGALSTEIVGSVKSSVNGPVSDATVTAWNIDDYGKVYHTRSDSAGRYVLDPGIEGRYIVYTCKPGFNLSAPVLVQVPSDIQFEIPLSRQLELLLVPHTK